MLLMFSLFLGVFLTGVSKVLRARAYAPFWKKGYEKVPIFRPFSSGKSAQELVHKMTTFFGQNVSKTWRFGVFGPFWGFWGVFMPIYLKKGLKTGQILEGPKSGFRYF
jgi:hypothetical protein